MEPADYPLRTTFATRCLQQNAADGAFPASVLFTDEASFTTEGPFNQNNIHLWALDFGESPWYANTCSSTPFLCECLGRYCWLPPHWTVPSGTRLDGRTHLIFLQQVLPELIGESHVPQSLRHSLWFQHDVAPPHYIIVRQYLNVTFIQHWMGCECDGPVHSPAKSPDISCLSFFCGGSNEDIGV